MAHPPCGSDNPSLTGKKAVEAALAAPITKMTKAEKRVALRSKEEFSSEEESDADSEESEESDSDEEEEELQGQMQDVPFEVLQQARSSGQLPQFSNSKTMLDTKRANKNRPMEISSKKPVGRFREVIQAPKREVRDPRFESLCGTFEENRFKKAYSFLYDEDLPAERQRLLKVVGKNKGAEDVEESEKEIAWIEKQLKDEEQRRKRVDAVAQHGHTEREAVKQGKKPFYPKKSEIRKEELVEKYQELKASGKLEKFVAKRRQKNAAKDHRFVPYRRPQA